jgi:hypothetical protein
MRPSASAVNKAALPFLTQSILEHSPRNQKRAGGAYVPKVVVGMYARFAVAGGYASHDLRALGLYSSPVVRRRPDNGPIHRDRRRRDACTTRGFLPGKTAERILFSKEPKSSDDHKGHSYVV